MKLLLTLLLASAATAQTKGPAVRTFQGEQLRVRLFENPKGIDPIIDQVKEGDGAIITLFFYQTLRLADDEMPVRLLRSRVTLCPIAPPFAAGGCDFVGDLKIDQIEFVRVKIFRELLKVDLLTALP